MDVGEFAQENKQWLVGCAIGAVVWLVGGAIVDSVTAPSPLPRRQDTLREAYKSGDLSAAQDQNDALTAERSRLTEQLSFVVAPAFSTWSGPADQHLFVTGRNLRMAIVDAASDRDVVVEEADITWDVPSGVDQIRNTLFGLDVIDEVQKRLFAAHDRALAVDESARGLAAITSVKLDSTRRRKSIGRSRSRRRGGVDVSDLIKQQRVSLQLQCDEPTLAYFLEACRAPGRTLVLDSLTVTEPARAGEVATVKATLAGISFVKEEEPK
ncbi:MAG: hypothetical protein CMJ88_10855 [Planctomycetes bacterium]|nr:hypothetical protein [Planctomycetota bacterium]